MADQIRYQLGDIAEVYGDVWLIEPVRRKADSIGDTYTFYQNRHRAMDAEVPATAEDTSMAMFKMESGVTVNWLISRGGTGSYGGELILGDQGCINGFGARGSRISMKRRDEEEMPQEDILASVDGFALEPLAEHLFPSRVTNKDSKVDWKIIALEYYELAEAILNGREIEVDGLEGLKDVAAIYAIFESARVGRAVKMSEVESRQVYNYQSEIDEVLGLV